MELHQVLQRIFLPLLLVKAEVFDQIRIATRLKHNLVLMALVRYIPVVLEHQFLVLLVELSIINKLLLKTLKRKQPGRSHQSQAMIVNSSGRDCQYKKCLGFNKPRKRPRSYPTRYQCEECTQEKGIDF
jgi:hypothetical protein